MSLFKKLTDKKLTDKKLEPTQTGLIAPYVTIDVWDTCYDVFTVVFIQKRQRNMVRIASATLARPTR